MPVKKTGYNGRRVMYFREDSKRDKQISDAEEEKRYHEALFEVCEKCLVENSLEEHRVPRRIGVCRICGDDGFITGCANGVQTVAGSKNRYTLTAGKV